MTTTGTTTGPMTRWVAFAAGFAALGLALVALDRIRRVMGNSDPAAVAGAVGGAISFFGLSVALAELSGSSQSNPRLVRCALLLLGVVGVAAVANEFHPVKVLGAEAGLGTNDAVEAAGLTLSLAVLHDAGSARPSRRGPISKASTADVLFVAGMCACVALVSKVRRRR